ncbi:MAG: 7-carboxy-7-deazaguanine synthase [Leptospiraceae bacterium]|nr:MAG: 7-carboxy-7-deazaguanine synthase [Leptospiraceae bacterium]
MKRIILAEPIHYVLQGEGINIGKKMILIRLAGCNIQCPECDTIYSWKFPKERKALLHLSLQELIEEIHMINKNIKVNHLLITGGEPAIWEKQLLELLINIKNFQFDIETSGYHEWNLIKSLKEIKHRIQFNISPKIGILKPARFLSIEQIKILKNPPENYIIKIVTSKNSFKEDLKHIKELMKLYQIPENKIFLMPFGKSREEIIEQGEFLIEQCFNYGFQFSPRLHILLFNNERLR